MCVPVSPLWQLAVQDTTRNHGPQNLRSAAPDSEHSRIAHDSFNTGVARVPLRTKYL
jgi:hypothetical protein